MRCPGEQPAGGRGGQGDGLPGHQPRPAQVGGGGGARAADAAARRAQADGRGEARLRNAVPGGDTGQPRSLTASQPRSNTAFTHCVQANHQYHQEVARCGVADRAAQRHSKVHPFNFYITSPSAFNEL